MGPECWTQIPFFSFVQGWPTKYDVTLHVCFLSSCVMFIFLGWLQQSTAWWLKTQCFQLLKLGILEWKPWCHQTCIISGALKLGLCLAYFSYWQLVSLWLWWLHSSLCFSGCTLFPSVGGINPFEYYLSLSSSPLLSFSPSEVHVSLHYWGLSWTHGLKLSPFLAFITAQRQVYPVASFLWFSVGFLQNFG